MSTPTKAQKRAEAAHGAAIGEAVRAGADTLMTRGAGTVSMTLSKLTQEQRKKIQDTWNACVVASSTALLLLLLGMPVHAQVIDTYELRIYASGSSTPAFTPVSSAVSGLSCNLTLPMPPAAPPVNPRYIYFNDPVNSWRGCRWDLQAGAVATQVAKLAPGTYTARVLASIAGQQSTESVATTFERAGPPPAPTGVFAAPA